MQTILFDLDGTLLDHFTTIHKCVAYAQRRLGLPEAGYDDVRSVVGGSVSRTLEQLVGSERVEAALHLFREHFEAIKFDDVFALPGAHHILGNLKARGHQLAVLTNKYGDDARATVAHLGMSGYFDVVAGAGDTTHRKPAPAFTQYALDQLHAKAEDSLLIGDSPYDFETAENAGLPVYLLSTGTHSREELEQSTGCRHIFANLRELGEAIFEIPREHART
ncbi:MAG: HAD family hydrolase [Opitutales bacterium]